MNKKLSKYKFKKFAEESLRNALRLHYDSMLLFSYASYPSAFHLSVLALEELSKADWIDNYYYTSMTNEEFPDLDFEQNWLKLLYSHPKKQMNFVARDWFRYTAKFREFIKEKKLEYKKQQSIYVGLKRSHDQIDTQSRISIPNKKIKMQDAKQLISLMNDEFLERYNLISATDSYWGIEALNEIIDSSVYQVLLTWSHQNY